MYWKNDSANGCQYKTNLVLTSHSPTCTTQNLHIACFSAQHGIEETALFVFVVAVGIRVKCIFALCSLLSNTKNFIKNWRTNEKSKILSVIQLSGEYSEADHCDWVDKHNLGVSHVGIPPIDWNIQSLIFDCFHGQCNYVKLQVAYIRKLFEGDYEYLDKFASF